MRLIGSTNPSCRRHCPRASPDAQDVLTIRAGALQSNGHFLTPEWGEAGRLFRPNAPRRHPQLVTKPCVVSFRSESWMPGHEIRKAFDLVRRLHDTHICSRRSDRSESAGDREDQVAARDHEDRRDKEGEAEHGTPSQAAFRQGPVHRRLLTSPRLDDGVRKVEIFFQRETSGAALLSAADQTHEVLVIEYFGR